MYINRDSHTITVLCQTYRHLIVCGPCTLIFPFHLKTSYFALPYHFTLYPNSLVFQLSSIWHPLLFKERCSAVCLFVAYYTKLVCSTTLWMLYMEYHYGCFDYHHDTILKLFGLPHYNSRQQCSCFYLFFSLIRGLELGILFI